MPRFDKPMSRRVAIVSVLLAALPSVILAQQDKPGPALPPPSLYDSVGKLPPGPAGKPAPTTTAVPPATTQPPAPQSQQAATTSKPSDYAVDGPNKTIRAGATGQCVKLGTTSPDNAAGQCDSGATAAPQVAPQPSTVPKTPAPATPAAGASTSKVQPNRKAAPMPEPVEVKRLEQQPAKEERALEPEPAPAGAVAAPKPAPAPTKETITLAADALFSLGSAAIKSTARESLDAFLKKVKGVEFDSIKVIGHTDPTGSAANNTKLSLQRAEAVKRYLVAKGLAANKIQTEGMGGSKPMVTDKDCSKLPRSAKIVCLEPDRRVEIEVVRATPKTAERQ